MTLLIIGSEGHIGKALAEESPGCFRVDIKPGVGDDYLCADVREFPDLAQAFNIAQPSVVVNFAAVVGREVAELSTASAVSTNVQGVLNVCRLCHARGARLIHVSTSEVYGPRHGTMNEDNPLMPNNWYGVSKVMGEMVVDYYRERGLRATTVRPFMLYSEKETRGAHRSAMIRFAEAIATGKPFTLHRDTERGWFHYDDAVRVLALLERTQSPPRHINIGNPDIRKVSNLIPLMERALGKKAKYTVEPLPARMTPVKNPCLDRQKALGFEPKVTLEEGVERVCKRLTKR